jgi:hypothetical protein
MLESNDAIADLDDFPAQEVAPPKPQLIGLDRR